jgi:hypothetical protein
MATCPFTNQEINIQMPNPGQMMFFYETPMTGKVKITDVALASANSLSIEEKQILVGICRNMTIRGEEPFAVTYAFLNQLRNQPIPYAFEERAKHLLQYLYDNGGKEYKNHNLNSDKDSPITYSSKDEFERIIEYLLDNQWINCEKETPTKQSIFYHGVRINKNGIAKIEGGLNGKEIVVKENELNEFIDDLEDELRNVIVNILTREIGKDDFEALITGDAKQQVRRRIELYLEKHPNKSKDDFKTLSKSIQFCDIEHLKKIVLKNEYWGFFEARFKDKIKVERYFNHFSELRHTVKHKREMTALVLHEGNAAVEWFRMVLQ